MESVRLFLDQAAADGLIADQLLYQAHQRLVSSVLKLNSHQELVELLLEDTLVIPLQGSTTASGEKITGLFTGFRSFIFEDGGYLVSNGEYAFHTRDLILYLEETGVRLRFTV